MFKVSLFDPKTLRWWWTQKDKIDMDPPYQRHGRLWSKTDKAFLIDSILNEYDVPKIYIADFTFGHATLLNKKRLSYAIIDGKQRLEAIIDFYDGDLVLDQDFVFESSPNLKLGGLGYADLKNNHPEIADVFDNFSLSVMRVITDEEEKINELFVRLNRSKPLTGAEIRNAMTGPVPQLTRLVTEHNLFKSFVSFSVSRGQDKNAAAKLLLFEFKEQPTETKRKNLDSFVKTAKKESKDKVELASRRVLETLDRMSEIFLPRDPLLASAGVLPVYYWFVRQRNPNEDSLVREFITSFERFRKANRQQKVTDKDLIEYDGYNRSTNDEKSYIGRVRILERRFKNYAEQPELKLK
jgi:Protein of unknown function DUF262